MTQSEVSLTPEQIEALAEIRLYEGMQITITNNYCPQRITVVVAQHSPTYQVISTTDILPNGTAVTRHRSRGAHDPK